MAAIGQLDHVAPVTAVLPKLGKWEGLEIQRMVRPNDAHDLAAVDNPKSIRSLSRSLSPTTRIRAIGGPGYLRRRGVRMKRARR